MLRKFTACLLAAVAATLPLFAEGDIRWLGTVKDFGAFAETDVPSKAEFRFINETGSPVVITSVRATCGCTTPTYSLNPIAPGDTATIAVAYDSQGRPGRFSKKIYVRTSASEARTDLVIKGVVLGSEESVSGRYPMKAGKLRLRNGAVMLGKVPKGRGKMESLQGYNFSTDTITPLVTAHPSWAEVAVVPPQVPPGQQMMFNVYFRSDRCPLWGVVSDSIVIVSDFNEKPVTIPLVGIVEEDFSRLTPGEMQRAPEAVLSTDRIDLGNIPAHASTPVKGTITLANRGKSTLKVRRIYADDSGLEVSIKDTSVKKGKSTQITVSVDVGGSDIINRRFTLITNDPLHPQQTVRVVGTVQR